MANVELVIKIPEDLYEAYKDKPPMLGDAGMDMIAQAISKGKALPKGHGDLIDTDDIRVIELLDSLHIIRHEKGDDIDVYIDAPIVIKADRSDKE